jgi:hypothetical protein
MEIIGKVAQLMPLVTGQGRNGEWRKQEFVIEIADGQFAKKVCFSLWGDRIDQAGLAMNETIKVFFDLESREYNGRWYTEARAWKVEKQGVTHSAAEAMPPVVQQTPAATFDATPVEDDLPF